MSSAGAYRTSTGKLTAAPRSTAPSVRGAPSPAARGRRTPSPGSGPGVGGEDVERNIDVVRADRARVETGEPGNSGGDADRATVHAPRRCRWTAVRRRSSRDSQRSSRRGEVGGRCAWRAGRCAGTSRTRSARCPRRDGRTPSSPGRSGIGSLARCEQELPLDPEGHRGDHAERAEADPGGREQLGVLGRGGRTTDPSAGTSSSAAIWADSEAPRVPSRGSRCETAPATVCRRCRPCWSAPDRGRESRALSTCSGVPASTVTVIASRSTLVSAAEQRVGPQQHPVGDRDVGERVARAHHLHGEASVAAGGDDRVDHLADVTRRQHGGRVGGWRARTSSTRRARSWGGGY